MAATTEALCLELAIFGLTGVAVNTGAVKTNSLANGVNFQLPPTSRYKSIEKEMTGRARGEDGTPRMEASVYAEKVVGDILEALAGSSGEAGMLRYYASYCRGFRRGLLSVNPTIVY